MKIRLNALFGEVRSRKGVGEFVFFAFFNSYEYFIEENTYFINSQRLKVTCEK